MRIICFVKELEKDVKLHKNEIQLIILLCTLLIYRHVAPPVSCEAIKVPYWIVICKCRLLHCHVFKGEI